MLYVTSWRHAWRQTYLWSISGTTHCRTSILVSISGFSWHGQAIQHNRNQISRINAWRSTSRHDVTLDVKRIYDLSRELLVVEHRSWCQFRGFHGQAIQQNRNQVCRINAWRSTSRRHAWRQMYLWSISGTTHCRTSMLMSISGFSRSSLTPTYVRCTQLMFYRYWIGLLALENPKLTPRSMF